MKVGSQTIWPPLLLAPMAGLTHSALRTTLLHFGGVGLLSTEMLSAARLPAESVDHSPYLFRTTKESPLSHQLMLTDEKHIAPAFAALHRLGADVIDLNLGCPAPQIRRSGGGSRLMEDPARVRRLVASARQHTSLPLTAKIRLGETLDAAKLRDFCRMLEGEGVDMITVHARLRGESFARRPRWEWVANVKRWIDIPVVANGGIDSIASARTCLEQSGADGLMIGRAAARSPWIFAVLARALYAVDCTEPHICLPQLYQGFATALVERFSPERRLGRLKEFTHHFATNYFFGHQLAMGVQSSRSFAEACSRASAFFAACDPCAEDNGKWWVSDAGADCNSQIPGRGI
ncbi:dihydrouridine synthase DuS [Desulfobulbus propionicus DSM 2032]|uniref:tRNA-dihydrouridine synthase n=1 Tax=Desulfobulbus propionicus (strain ATCC 33891 / DSM 2032 / VKM B-1956 / 1pr3) TaxID=577650 RepID=A0A7U3YP31_DESPD|nr:tRNA-dihydrouridine synthase family protein [Desulfobulbus propionicus]ADW18932.1 dihydrouridine synthase DuS [Desulfobulbus propionicus DSM 2032]